MQLNTKKLSEDSKKRVDVLHKPEMLTLDFDEDDLPLEGDEEVKLEPGETIAEKLKLNARKRKIPGTGLKILTLDKLLTRLPISLKTNESWKQFTQIKK